MSIIYNGFSLSFMLEYLREHADTLQLEALPKGVWGMYVLSDKYGEYENTGTLTQVVIGAFKPFAEDAKKHKDELCTAFAKLCHQPNNTVDSDMELYASKVDAESERS